MARGCRDDGGLDDGNFSSPLPIIGIYVTLATLYCAIMMAVSVILGLRSRRLWFPCNKYFTLNAATLTVLAIAAKLPVDLNTSMPRRVDQLSKLSGTTLICTVMGNLIPSLGVISNVRSNIVALGILVITVAANVCVQMGTGAIYVYLPEHSLILLFMLVLLILTISSALPISTTKRELEKVYNKKNIILQANTDHRREALEDQVKKYWVMAHTGSPQYVVGRSATCTASGVFSLFSAVILFEATLRSFVGGHPRFCDGASDYGWSIYCVLITQEMAVLVGVVAPTVRLFTAVSYRRFGNGNGANWRKEFRVEKYWTEKLREWKEGPLPTLIRKRHHQQIFHSFRGTILGSLIMVQIGVVRASKFARLPFILLMSGFHQVWKLFNQSGNERSPGERSSELEEFVLRLEGEDALVKLISKHEKGYLDKCIQDGEKKRPKFLCKLIEKRIESHFKWVSWIDNGDRVRNLAADNGGDREPNLAAGCIDNDGDRVLNVVAVCIDNGRDEEINLAEGSLGNGGNGVSKLEASYGDNGRDRVPNLALGCIANGGDREPSLAAGYIGNVPNVAEPEGTRIPPYCWALPIVTLASIAVAIAGAKNRNSLKPLLKQVGEGLKYVKQIEAHLEAKGLINQREAADVVWTSLNLNHRWLNFDLRHHLREDTANGVIEKLIGMGKRKVIEFLKDGKHDNNLEWPPKVLAANCLYRLASTIKQLCEENPDMRGDYLFSWLSEAIGDLLGACLTNLPEAIYLECFCNAVEVREESVRRAASLFGETKHIMEKLSDPNLTPFFPTTDKEYLDGWRNRTASGQGC